MPKQLREAGLGVRVARDHDPKCRGSHQNFTGGSRYQSPLALTAETRNLDYAGRPNQSGGWEWLVLRCSFRHAEPHCRAEVLIRRSKIEEVAHNTAAELKGLFRKRAG